MNTVYNIYNKVGQGFHTTLEIAAYTVTHSEALEKVAKIADRIISALGVIYENVSAAVVDFGSRLKSAILVFESLRFVGIMSFLVTPKNGKYFLADAANSWQKRLDRITLAFHCAFKTVKGLNKFGFVQLGVMAKNAIGKLPIFVLVMDSFIVASSFFGAWDSVAKGLPKAAKKIANADQKIDKWTYRSPAISFLKVNDEVTRANFETLYKKKAAELRTEAEKLEKNIKLNDDKIQKTLEIQQTGKAASLPKAAQEKIIAECQKENKENFVKVNKIKNKIDKTDLRIAKLASGDCKGLAEDFEKSLTKNITKNIDGTLRNYKIEKWKIEKVNAKQERSRVWIEIANAVGKIAVVAFALTLTALNVWTAPFLLSLLAMGIIVDSIGYSKILVKEFWKPQAIPQRIAMISI